MRKMLLSKSYITQKCEISKNFAWKITPFLCTKSYVAVGEHLSNIKSGLPVILQTETKNVETYNKQIKLPKLKIDGVSVLDAITVSGNYF